jgi:hypothetical protein
MMVQAPDSNLSDEEKVIRLARVLLNGRPAACKRPHPTSEVVFILVIDFLIL